MNIESLRQHCLSFPRCTEHVQWGDNLVFKVGGKMFAVAALDPASPHRVAFKCTPEDFAELTERDDIIPAPYLARAQWVSVERWNALRDSDLLALLRTAYDLVYDKLPRKVKATLDAAPARTLPGKKKRKATRS